MQFDFFDKKIKEAADHHHPAYDENAWKKMENLLDKHMPKEKNDRRRFIFFLLLFLFLGGGAYLIIGKPWKNNKAVAGIEKKTEQNIPIVTAPEKNTSQQQSSSVTPENSDYKDVENNEVKLNDNNKSAPKIKIEKQQASLTITKKSNEKQIAQTVSPFKPKPKNQNKPNVLPNSAVKSNDNPVTTAPDNNSWPTSESNDAIVKKDVLNKENVAKTNEESLSKNSEEPEKKNLDIKNEQPDKKNKGKSSKPNFFAFTLSAGPDFSKAGKSGISDASFSVGAGISYTLNRFTIRTGFYSAKKIYRAKPDDYKLSYVLPSNIKLLNVNADCKVFEIPVSLTYSFGNKEKSNWYAGIGLSSYLMKTEKYNNLYKNTNSGSVYYRSFEYKNENKHIFSVLNLSGGYTYKLNKTFSLSAEPYLRIPLEGVGEGKVHLNSAGVLFSVGVRPFK